MFPRARLLFCTGQIDTASQTLTRIVNSSTALRASITGKSVEAVDRSTGHPAKDFVAESPKPAASRVVTTLSRAG
jgi:hypothetical protein